MNSSQPSGIPPRLVLFDGVCGFCDRAVVWLLARDRDRRLHFAPLQGRTAAELRTRHPEIPEDLDTMVYVESDASGERVSLRSEAVLRVLAELPHPWRAFSALRWLPRALTDWAYGVFARNRYRLFGKRDDCAIPDADDRARVIA